MILIFTVEISNFSMTKNEALNLFANHISTAYLFGKSVAKQIEIVKLEFTNAIHVRSHFPCEPNNIF